MCALKVGLVDTITGYQNWHSIDKFRKNIIFNFTLPVAIIYIEYIKTAIIVYLSILKETKV